MIEAMVYWKEERTLLPYAELEPESQDDSVAWQGHELKLDRDTVDTQDEIAGSNYLLTHSEWIDWMELCITRGKPYCMLKADALRAFQDEDTSDK